MSQWESMAGGDVGSLLHVYLRGFSRVYMMPMKPCVENETANL